MMSEEYEPLGLKPTVRLVIWAVVTVVCFVAVWNLMVQNIFGNPAMAFSNFAVLWFMFTVVFSNSIFGEWERAVTVYRLGKEPVEDWIIGSIKLKDFEKNKLPENLQKHYYRCGLIKKGEKCIILTPHKPIVSRSGRFFGLIKHEIYFATAEGRMELVDDKGNQKEVMVFYSDLLIEQSGRELLEKATLLSQINELESRLAERVPIEEYAGLRNLLEQTKASLLRVINLRDSVPQLEQSPSEKLKEFLMKPSTWLIFLIGLIMGFILGRILG